MEFRVKTDGDSYNFEAFVMKIGEDFLISIWGGEKPHIGAVAFAQPRPNLKDHRARSATASVFCYPGHKDDIIAKKAAESLSAALDANVTVTAGLHWDDIDEQGIKCVIENSQHLIEAIIKKLDLK